jgi:hypothetical protein
LDCDDLDKHFLPSLSASDRIHATLFHILHRVLSQLASDIAYL